MIIREMISSDMNEYMNILCSVYNNELWMCRWDKKTAAEYLNDFYESKKEQGYGKNAIDAKLKRKGIPEEILHKLDKKEEESETNREQILSLLERKDKPNTRKPIQKRKEILFAL